ncbi:MAG: hypothetical protein KDJ70_11790 [Candidatus Competibacteraceae bacterium]|nr:hypothetical protein [Candidatus Competibacteraceae bacterium]
MSTRPHPNVHLPTLARLSGMPEATLRNRLARNGNNLARAVGDPPCSHQAAGRIGAKRSPWRYPAV